MWGINEYSLPRRWITPKKKAKKKQNPSKWRQWFTELHQHLIKESTQNLTGVGFHLSVFWNDCMKNTLLLFQLKNKVEIPWIHWCRSTNALPCYEYFKRIVTMKPQSLRVKQTSSWFFLWGLDPEDHSLRFKRCKISQTEAHNCWLK